MRIVTHVLVLFAVAAVLVGGAAALPMPGLGSGLGVLADLAREQERGRQLSRQNRALSERNEAKQEVIGQVRDRRLTLEQAAAEFRRIHERTQADIEGAPGAGPQDLSEEELCRNILAWVRTYLPDHPESAPVLAELEAEFAAHFGHAPPTPADRTSHVQGKE
jgi:hypothetical protein